MWSAVGIRGRTPHMEQDGDDQDGGVTMVIRRLGTSCGGYDPGYPRQTTWAAPPGADQPTRRSLAGHDSTRCLPQDMGKDILKILRDLLGYI